MSARVLIVRQGWIPLDPRVRREMEALRRQGYEVDVICRRRAGHPSRERTASGTIWRLPGIPGRGGAALYLAQYAWFMTIAMLWAGALHLRRRYDLIQVNSLPDTLVFSALLPRLMGVPVLLDLHEVMPEFFATKFGVDLTHPLVRIVAAFEQLSTRFATHVLTCTDQMRDAFVKRGTPAAKITVVLNSADEEIFTMPAIAPAKNPDEFTVVCHGTIEERYGHEEVVRAVGLLRDEIPGLRLRVFGEGAHLPAVESLARQLGIEDRVWFSRRMVPLEQLIEGIARADVGVVAMRRDAFRDLTHCNKMFDFITMRVPAAVSRTRSVEEYFDEDCFELFESGNAAQLAAAISRIWRDPARRAQLVEHAAAVNEPYRWPRQQEIYATTVAAVMARKRIPAQPRSSVPVRTSSLYAQNTPASFWKLIAPVPTEHEWRDAVAACAHLLPAEVAAHAWDLNELLEAALGEGQFGDGHWNLSMAKRTYYDLKPWLPRFLTLQLRRAYGRRNIAAAALDWPYEGRYSRFLGAVLRYVLDRRGLDSAEHVSLWPRDARFAFVLTHDVELQAGHDFVLKVAELDERYGFRSSFNFVPERYGIDAVLIDELKARGFEVGVHDLNHDGKLFRSRRIFNARATRINEALSRAGASGFRAALFHRNPEWMQELELEYDLSFFDTDPYEPIPGGTMTLWPFILGRFVELPHTLVQDYTLTEILRETTPRMWLDKVDFIAERRGMALLNSHPDYLRAPRTWNVYEEFLARMSERNDFWHALPRDVARWWRARMEAPAGTIPDGGSRVVFRTTRETMEDETPELVANLA